MLRTTGQSRSGTGATPRSGDAATTARATVVCTRSESGSVGAVTVHGPCGEADLPALLAAVEGMSGCYLLVVDLQDCPRMDLVVVQALVTAADSAADHGRRLLLAHCDDVVELGLRLLGAAGLATGTTGDWQAGWR